PPLPPPPLPSFPTRRSSDLFGQQVARRDLGLVASEGRFTIPVDDDSAAGVLAIHTSFYEFIAEEDIDDPTPRALLCHELTEGSRSEEHTSELQSRGHLVCRL